MNIYIYIYKKAFNLKKKNTNIVSKKLKYFILRKILQYFDFFQKKI